MKESQQPKENSDYLFAFNGEIYAQSSHSLQEKGIKSDTEFMWNKLIVEGPTRFLHDLSGEYSVVVYDKRRDLLFYPVDYFGVKPFTILSVIWALVFQALLKIVGKIFA